MFCINCFHSSTKVTNSRPHKKRPQVWRRRTCRECGTTFTTYERVSLAETRPVYLASGEKGPFSLSKLTLSISKSFTHAPYDAEYSSLWLAQTVEDTLSTQYETITTESIEAVTHTTLKNFDELAAVQYAVQHRLISSTKRRRGRPSLREHEPLIRESPSQ